MPTLSGDCAFAVLMRSVIVAYRGRCSILTVPDDTSTLTDIRMVLARVMTLMTEQRRFMECSAPFYFNGTALWPTFAPEMAVFGPFC